MDKIEEVQHPGLHEGRWKELSFSQQMGNIGSEVSRMLKWKGKGNPERSERAFFRALELIDLTIAVVQSKSKSKTDCSGNVSVSGRLKELCRAREELCDLFTDAGTIGTDPERLMRYYDQFAMMNTR